LHEFGGASKGKVSNVASADHSDNNTTNTNPKAKNLDEKRSKSNVGGEEALFEGENLSKFDMVCVLYDGSNETSLNQAAEKLKAIRQQDDEIPIVLLMTKDDLPTATQVQHLLHTFG
jgi:hypothetical protein